MDLTQMHQAPRNPLAPVLAALSTAHLTPKTLALLADDAMEGVVAYPNDYGAFVWVPTSDIAEWNMPDDMRQALALAQKHGVTYIRFDADAITLDGILPTYEHN